MPQSLRVSEPDCCSLLCFVKTTLIVILSLFVLYIPLGDPNVKCRNLRENGLMCHLCRFHHLMSKVAEVTARWVEVSGCLMMKLLYEAKLRFYSFLELVDRQDLCRSVCCADCSDPVAATADSKVEKQVPCKCSKSKCCRRRR